MASLGRIKPRSLNICTYNASGLIDQISEVREFVVKHQIDILLIQETFLKPSIRDPKIANYNIIRNDRATALGGTVIYYRRSLHCVPLDPPQLTNIEATVCHIGMTGHQSIVLVSAYLSPTKDILESDLRSIMSMGNSVILAGDLNCKHPRWNSRISNSKGVRLNAILDGSRNPDIEIVAPTEPTRYPIRQTNDNADVLDIALLKSITLQVRSLEVLAELDSDHRPVLLQLGHDVEDRTIKRKITDWKRLRDRFQTIDTAKLNITNDTVTSISAAKEANSKIIEVIKNTVDDCSRECSVPFEGRWPLPEAGRKLINRKNAATRAYHTYPTDANRRRLWRLQRKVRYSLADLCNDQWDKRLSELSPSHQAYWSLSRALRNEGTSTMPPLVKQDNTLAVEDPDKAECMADTYETQFTPNTHLIDTEHLLKVNSDIESRVNTPPTDSALSPTSVEEVNTIVKNLHAKKAPGIDNISNKVIKFLPTQIIYLLVIIFNALLAGSSFPDEWKEAIVIGIHKPGKARNIPASYRPISLLNCISKIYERIILVRLKAVVEAKALIIPEQFGFRAQHSSVHQVHRLTEHIHTHFNKLKRPIGTGVLFFDVAKAFDRVWHNGLLYKLYQMSVPDSLVHIIRDYLTNRSFRVRVEGILSTPRPIRAGVPQGSVLGPILYTLYTSDIPRYGNTNLALYADDTALYTSSMNVNTIVDRLQKAVIELGLWFRKWGIEINPDKSAAVFFYRTVLGSHSRRKPQTPITLYDKPIPWRQHAKYLGVTLDTRLTFRKHIDTVRNRAAFILGRLYPMLGKHSKLSLRNKVTLYKLCIRPIMTYASVVFAQTRPSHLDKLQKLQNRFTRIATGSPWYMRTVDLHKDLQLESIKDYMKTTSTRYFLKAPQHPNHLLVEAANYDPVNDIIDRTRRPKDVLTDPDDSITVSNSIYRITHRQNTHTHRPRRRGRGPLYVTARSRLGV